ncbi:Uncharacterised protein [Klebsiella variicola]|uniref:Uncharacterized protein n=1 Tax=Klebsiella variicola TaxID=244366 RepID=A0A7H4MML8_KLEVA|nr:Uncharacterised protein [Klebsiella variicola]
MPKMVATILRRGTGKMGLRGWVNAASAGGCQANRGNEQWVVWRRFGQCRYTWQMFPQFQTRR